MRNETKHNYSIVVYTIVLIFAFILQKTDILFKPNSPAPNFVLAVLLIVSFFESFWFSSMFGLACGILVDATTVNGFGQHALLYMLTGFFCSLLLEWLFQNNFASFAIVSLPLITIHQFIEMIINSGFTNGIFSLFFRFFTVVILYTFFVSFLLYAFFYFVVKRNTRFRKPIGIIKK